MVLCGYMIYKSAFNLKQCAQSGVVLEKEFKLKQWRKNANYVFFHNWINKLFSKGNKVPGRCLKARKVAGSATSKQSGTVWNSVVL